MGFLLRLLPLRALWARPAHQQAPCSQPGPLLQLRNLGSVSSCEAARVPCRTGEASVSFLSGLFPQQLEHLEKSSQPAGLVKAGLALLEPALDDNSAVITTIFFTYCYGKGNPLLFFFFNLIEDTIKRKYAGVFNKNMMEENIQSSIIRSNLHRERRCRSHSPPPWLCSVRGWFWGWQL